MILKKIKRKAVGDLRHICIDVFEARVEYLFATTATPPSEVLRAFISDRRRTRR